MIRGAFPPITTRQSFVDEIEVFSDDDGAPFDLTGATAQVAIASAAHYPRSWNSRFYDSCAWPAPRLIASVALVAASGVIVFTFTQSQIETLCPGQYVVAANLSRGGETVQLVLGDLSVLDGVVPQ